MTNENYDEKVARLEQAIRKRDTKKRTTGNGEGHADAPTDWRSKLMPKGNTGLYVGTEHNIIIAMREAPELKGLMRFNEFALQEEFTRSPPWREAPPGSTWTEEDDTACAAWLQGKGLCFRGNRGVADCAAVVARDSTYHPVRDYLKPLQWDHVPRLDTFLETYFGATGDKRYLRAVGSRFMISAIARAFRAGCQVDSVLVLEGEQGAGKTEAVRTLALRSEWCAGDLPDLRDKDARLQLLGRWLVEISELKAIKESETEAQKSYLTQRHDTFRPPYARRAAQFPRQCVFIATTNEDEYLRDPTGNRRFWPVRCGRIDIDALARERDQLWAEAAHRFNAGEQWHLTPQEERLASIEQQERVYESELEQAVRRYVGTCNEVIVEEVLTLGLGLVKGEHYAEKAQRLGWAVAKALRRCGFRKHGRQGRGKETVYRRAGPGPRPDPEPF